MTIPFHRSVAFAGLLLAGSFVGQRLPAASAQEPVKTPGQLAIEKRVVLTLRIEALDPFNPMYAKGAKGPPTFAPGTKFRVVVEGQPQPKGYTYSILHDIPDGKGTTTQFQLILPQGAGLRAVPPVREVFLDPGTARKFGEEYKLDQPFLWSQDVVISPEAKFGSITVEAKVFLQTCDERTCTTPENYAPLKAVVLIGDPNVEPPAAAVKKTPNQKAIENKVTLSLRIEAPDQPGLQKDKGAKPPPTFAPGTVFRVVVEGQPRPTCYTYSAIENVPEGKGTKTKFALIFPEGSGLQALPPVSEAFVDPQAKRKPGEEYKLKEPFTWSQDVLVLPDAKPGSIPVEAKVFLQACNEVSCTTPADHEPLKATVKIDGPKAALTPDLTRRLADALRPPVDPTVVTPGNTSQALIPFLLGAMGGAIAMLLTPCVFPMIPITVNFFLKQSEREHHSPLPTALVYSGTIIVLLTAVMLSLGGVVIALANDPWFNLVMGAVLIIFALSLFGLFEIQLPSFLARFTMAHEGQGGYAGAIFMALTFTITSFTCTGPFLGAMIGGLAAVRPPFYQLVMGALVYSTTFALPFFVLALIPGVLKKLPKSGGWMNNIKVVMGFVEVAAALKFLSNTDFALFPGQPVVFTFDAVLVAWIVLAVAAGLYLLGLFRLPHDHEAVGHIGVVRLGFAVLFIGLGLYLTPALFGIKPRGWLGEQAIAFAPPGFRSGGLTKEGIDASGATVIRDGLVWHLDYEGAYQEALARGVPIFIDFTGQNCVNCRDNEENVFPDPRVKKLFQGYALAQLYTDFVPKPGLSSSEAAALAAKYDKMRNAIGDASNPSYFVFQPSRDGALTDKGLLNGKVLATTKGKISNKDAFVALLEQNQKKVQQASAAASEVQPWPDQVANNAKAGGKGQEVSLLTQHVDDAVRQVGATVKDLIDPPLHWHLDYQAAWKEAVRRDVPVFIDFTGINNVNCRDNEENVFTEPRIKKAFKGYARSRLYTDSVPVQGLTRAESRAWAEKNAHLRDALGEPTWPAYYVIMPNRETPFTENGLINGKVVAKTGGKIFDKEAFALLLEKQQKE